jgi:hypothetical protein
VISAFSRMLVAATQGAMKNFGGQRKIGKQEILN